MITNKISFPIDKEDPMNGIFTFFRERGELERNVMGFSQTMRSDSKQPLDLLLHKKETFYVSKGNLYDNFEFSIVNYEVFINGYALMAYYNDDNAQRNWNISCIKSTGIVTISEEKNNKEMCDGKTGVSQKCLVSDKKAFIAQNPTKCNRIRYTIL